MAKAKCGAERTIEYSVWTTESGLNVPVLGLRKPVELYEILDRYVLLMMIQIWLSLDVLSVLDNRGEDVILMNSS
jgi:hypothetical protein